MGKFLAFLLLFSSIHVPSSWAFKSTYKLQHEAFNISNSKPIQQDQTFIVQDLDHISVGREYKHISIDDSMKARRGTGGAHGGGGNIDNKPLQKNGRSAASYPTIPYAFNTITMIFYVI